MRELKAMSYLPLVGVGGVIVNRSGYDEDTGVFLAFDDSPDIPDEPSRSEIIAAIKVIWKPWSNYTLATDHDRAAMFSAIVTAICRPALYTCPGFFFDAPVQSSGKTKAAAALGALIQGERVGVTPFVDCANGESEMLKKLVSLALIGAGFFLVDNVVGCWRSPVLAALITSGGIDERVLGLNLWYRGVSRMMVVATGNNATLDRDLGRRFIRVRIDPGVECPQGTPFPFDPVDMALSMRLAIAHSVLVLVRAWQVAGSPKPPRGDCGFSEWNGVVRALTLWLQGAGLVREAELDPFGDPAFSILENAAEDDPDTGYLKMLLHGLQAVFMVKQFTASEAHVLYKNDGGNEGAILIREALEALAPKRQELSVTSIGRIFRYRRDRIAGGLVLRHVGEDRNGVGSWCVEKAAV